MNGNGRMGRGLRLSELLTRRPNAFARMEGSGEYPDLSGLVRFYTTPRGVVTVAEFTGLPTGDGCDSPVFGFHIHEGGACAGSGEDPFSEAGLHYNPYRCPHPYHAGDMPPIFGADGRAFLAFLSDRFTVREVIGRTVILHVMPDDFMTQPSGNSGAKIACGVIRAPRMR